MVHGQTPAIYPGTVTPPFPHHGVARNTLALMLMFSGFSLCYWILRRSRLFTIRMAFGTYVLAALGMAGVYYLVHVSHPNCYAFGADVAPSASVLDFVYFSFVTVTTLGYGDIVPNHTFVRMLVVIQILFGVMLILRAAPHPASIEAARAHENAAPPSGRPSKTTSTEEQNDDT